ncbi:MAG: hypothetical protein RLP02_07285, partial [Coleofasciculus sp. C2-GNP5-27]
CTEFGSVKLTSKSRNALFFVLTLPCLLVYLSSLSYLNRNLKKPTLVSTRGEGSKKEVSDVILEASLCDGFPSFPTFISPFIPPFERVARGG